MIEKPLDLALLRIQPLDDPFPNFLELKIGGHVLISGSSQHVPLSRFTQLKKLHLEVDPSAFESAAQNPATLPILETLVCDVSSTEAYKNAGAIPGHWRFSRLRNLTVRMNCNIHCSVSLTPIKTLCAAYGAHLTSLHIYSNWIIFTENLSGIYDLCPNVHQVSYSYDHIPLLISDTSISTLSGPAHARSALRCVSLPRTSYSYGDPRDNLREHLSELTQRSLYPSIGTIIMLDPQLYGDVVDGSALHRKYAEILHDWSARLRELGIRFLNSESQPLNIVLSPEGLEDEDETDSDDSSSVSEETESDDSDEGSVADSLLEEINRRLMPFRTVTLYA